MKLTAELIKEFREISGFCLMECKHWLTLANSEDTTEKEALYAKGRTKKGSKATNAKGGQSIHNYGLAFDIVLMYDKDGDGKFEEVSWDTKRDGDKDGIPDWLEVTQVFVAGGYQNGFITNGKKWDFPHFQKTSYSWKQLYKMLEDGNYTKEIINGIEYKYINI